MKNSTLLLLMAVALLQGCASSTQTWYKPGGTQREFDLDSKECEIIAEQQALFKSETGKRSNPLDYAEFYQRCIITRGWSTMPEAESKPDNAAPAVTALGSLEGNQLNAFDHRIILPATAQLQTNKRNVLGPTRTESFFFSQGEYFLNIILQQSDTATFQSIGYPVENPYRLYTSGGKDNMRWSAFWGRIGNDWVKGVGSFVRYSEDKRSIIVITSPLEPPDGKAPEGLSLAANQQREMGRFVNHWRLWLEEQSSPPALWKQGLLRVWEFFKQY